VHKNLLRHLLEFICVTQSCFPARRAKAALALSRSHRRRPNCGREAQDLLAERRRLFVSEQAEQRQYLSLSLSGVLSPLLHLCRRVYIHNTSTHTRVESKLFSIRRALIPTRRSPVARPALCCLFSSINLAAFCVCVSTLSRLVLFCQ
jgi:hypothetical protein